MFFEESKLDHPDATHPSVKILTHPPLCHPQWDHPDAHPISITSVIHGPCFLGGFSSLKETWVPEIWVGPGMNVCMYKCRNIHSYQCVHTYIWAIL